VDPTPPDGPWVGRLLVSAPALTDPHFDRTVVLLLQHDDDSGARGVVLNRPSDTPVGTVLPAWEERAAVPALVFFGGPVQPDAAICLGRRAPGAVATPGYAPLVRPNGALDPQLGTVDLDGAVVPDLRDVRVFAGYAGWSAGQLEGEVAVGAWWVLDALPGDAFDPAPTALWPAVLRRQGLPLALAASAPADPRLN
jgi:putative transcriptional regulator